jgi:CheY-like chemotaxis protein
MEPKLITPDAKKILIVDDNKVILKAMSFVLTNKGYHVFVAESGAETIIRLRMDKPDLILMDLDFPPDELNPGGALRDGFLIIDWARRMCDAEKIPVIILSSADPNEYKERAQAAGILTFFRKPVDNRQLLEAIHITLNDAPVAQSTSA